MLRALQLAPALLLLGTPLFLLLVWRPALARAPAGEGEALAAAPARRLAGGQALAFALLLLTSLLELVDIASDLAGAPAASPATLGTAATILLRGERGRLFLLRVLFGAGALAWTALAAASGFGAVGGAGSRSAPAERRLLAAAACGLGVLATFSVAGHASAIPARWAAAVLSDLLHFLAASAWGGGLWCLALLPWGRLTRAPALGVLRETVRRFSRLALGSVALLLATGIFLSTQLFYGPTALFETAYGKYLVWKLVLLAVVLFVAKDNLLAIPARLGRVAAGGDDLPAVVRSFRRNVLAEAVAIALAVAAAGLLTTASAQVRLPLPLTVAITPSGFEPATLELPKGRLVRLTVVNRDRVTHSLAFEGMPYEGPASHVHDPAAVSPSDLVVYVPPSRESVVVFRALRFGSFPMVDVLEDFADRGFAGSAVVR